jgi:hypothetical protein
MHVTGIPAAYAECVPWKLRCDRSSSDSPHVSLAFTAFTMKQIGIINVVYQMQMTNIETTINNIMNIYGG